MKKSALTAMFFVFAGCCLLASCGGKKPDPCAQTKKLSGGTLFIGNSNGHKPLADSPYGYEIWSAGGNDHSLTWYGPKQGGGAAFRAEWNNPNDFLGRVGYYWNVGKPYEFYGDLRCDFNFARSENGTGGPYSYIGIYGWTKSSMIEWYIVEDWYGDGIMGPANMGGGAEKAGEFELDGGVYFIYKATRPAGSGNIEGSRMPFPQYFSVRQTRRQCGTISIAEHFKEWEKAGLKMGANMYEAKFLVEAGGGTGWFDATYLSFYQD